MIIIQFFRVPFGYRFDLQPFMDAKNIDLPIFARCLCLIYLFFDLPIFLVYLFLLDAVLVNHGNLLNGLGNKSAD